MKSLLLLCLSILWNKIKGGGGSYGTSEERSRNLQNKAIFVCVSMCLNLLGKFKKLREKNKRIPPQLYWDKILLTIQYTYLKYKIQFF